MMDGLPADGLQDIRALKRDVVQAQKTAGQRPAATKASKGWRLGADGVPDFDDLEDGEVHIRSEGGSLVVRSEDGDVVVSEVEFGPSIGDPPEQTASPLPGGGEVTGADFNKLGADNAALAAYVLDLVTVLRSGRWPS